MNSVDGKWTADKVFQVDPIQVENWISNEMPALLTDLVISMNDRCAYVAGWLHGCVWQLDISDPFRTSFLSRVRTGLSVDGRRLYVTNSFYKQWDAQFYPELIVSGGQIARIDIDEKGNMLLSDSFLIDLKDMEGGPFLARDLHFFNGDSTSDNFL
ncbi:hypothetical protein OESDEN_04792 [Oesophagostomum dentatum]|uniref:Uncharacterized protein n=1 Tax=Oesophagostomum dentatum TaxID=61180 RepID=A0A0B1TDC4_OESDE|nr:hypothetical protein OESDEN_04792 [Oesophagostomum dentatum]